jgi:hypothetical protein
VYYASIRDQFDDDGDGLANFVEAQRRQDVVTFDKGEIFDEWSLESLTIHAKIHVLSKKHNIPNLTKVSCERFVDCVVHVIDRRDTDRIPVSCHADDLAQGIKVVYRAEQESDRIPQEGAVCLAREFAKTITDYEEAGKMGGMIQAFRETCRSVDDCAWDMITLDLKKVQIVCHYCKYEFMIPSSQVRKIDCKCAKRGICGNCAPMSKLECGKCYNEGDCRLIRWRTRKPSASPEASS